MGSHPAEEVGGTNLISGEKEEEGHAELGHEVERLALCADQVEAVRSQDGARKNEKDDLGNHPTRHDARHEGRERRDEHDDGERDELRCH